MDATHRRDKNKEQQQKTDGGVPRCLQVLADCRCTPRLTRRLYSAGLVRLGCGSHRIDPVAALCFHGAAEDQRERLEGSRPLPRKRSTYTQPIIPVVGVSTRSNGGYFLLLSASGRRSERAAEGERKATTTATTTTTSTILPNKSG